MTREKEESRPSDASPLALGRALYDGVHLSAARGELDDVSFLLGPLWDWHQTFVDPGSERPEGVPDRFVPEPGEDAAIALGRSVRSAIRAAEERGEIVEPSMMSDAIRDWDRAFPAAVGVA